MFLIKRIKISMALLIHSRLSKFLFIQSSVSTILFEQNRVSNSLLQSRIYEHFVYTKQSIKLLCLNEAKYL